MLLSVGMTTEAAQFFVALLMAIIPVPFYLALARSGGPFRARAVAAPGEDAVLFAAIFNGIGEGILASIVGAGAASTLTARDPARAKLGLPAEI